MGQHFRGLSLIVSLSAAACVPRPGTTKPAGTPAVEGAEVAGLPSGEDEGSAPPVASNPALIITSEMISFPAGEFPRGAVGGRPDEQPVRIISLAAFSIDRTEVDVGAYALCVAAGACSAAGKGAGCNAARLDRTRHPINCITWAQADAYCKQAGKRLPTEAEWERAARSGEPRPYVWGDTWPPPRGAGNFSDRSSAQARPYWSPVEGNYDDGFPETAPVDARSIPTLQGGLHFAGNVAEWVADYYDAKAYDSAVDKDPTGPKRGHSRVVRGASFGHAKADDLRATHRSFYDPTETSQHFGVRCAKSSS